ncbi:MAG: non-canonical purine NTP pyrophosphatase [Planctomycetota bacterium]|nr:MAG: non-canonical purine NTP pyrophosphatase [Planctomycetota bacterium]
MQKILVASGNPKKLAELRAMLTELPVELLGPEALPGGLPEVVEDGADFLANAAAKALAFAEAAVAVEPGIWALADDSGLCVDALDGAPGVHSARFAALFGPAGALAPDADRAEMDEANNRLLLERLAGLPPEQRGAAFHCVIAVARPGELLFAVEGRVAGRILEAPDGDGGFGYDPLFWHEASGCSFARLDPAAKAAVSHRGQAVARLERVLSSVLPRRR